MRLCCNGRALPPVAALIRLLQHIQLFLQPYVERGRAAREAVQEWWAVREERCVLLSLCCSACAALHALAIFDADPVTSSACPDRYREFIGEETKRKWEWQCRHEKEHAFWLGVVRAIWGAQALLPLHHPPARPLNH